MYTPREGVPPRVPNNTASTTTTANLQPPLPRNYKREAVLVSLDIRRFIVSSEFAETFSPQLQHHHHHQDKSNSSSCSTSNNTSEYTFAISRANKKTAFADKRWRHDVNSTAEIDSKTGNVILDFTSPNELKFVLSPEIAFSETLIDRILLLEVFETPSFPTGATSHKMDSSGNNGRAERSIAFATIDPSTFIGKPQKEYSIKFSATHRRCRENPSRQQDAGKLSLLIRVLPASSEDARNEVVTFKRVVIRIERIASMTPAKATNTLTMRSPRLKDLGNNNTTTKVHSGETQGIIEPGSVYQLRLKYCGNIFSTPYRAARTTQEVAWGTTLACDVFPDDDANPIQLSLHNHLGGDGGDMASHTFEGVYPRDSSTPSTTTSSSLLSINKKLKFSIWRDDDERCATFAVAIDRIAGKDHHHNSPNGSLDRYGRGEERTIRLPFRFDTSRGFDPDALAELVIVTTTETTTTLRKHIVPSTAAHSPLSPQSGRSTNHSNTVTTPIIVSTPPIRQPPTTTTTTPAHAAPKTCDSTPDLDSSLFVPKTFISLDPVRNEIEGVPLISIHAASHNGSSHTDDGCDTSEDEGFGMPSKGFHQLKRDTIPSKATTNDAPEKVSVDREVGAAVAAGQQQQQDNSSGISSSRDGEGDGALAGSLSSMPFHDAVTLIIPPPLPLPQPTTPQATITASSSTEYELRNAKQQKHRDADNMGGMKPRRNTPQKNKNDVVLSDTADDNDPETPSPLPQLEEVWKRRAIAAEEENVQLRDDLHRCLMELARKEGENTALLRQMDMLLSRLSSKS